ncbi:Trp biosynthesis-associated membrane protein [Lipingzhangella sp. LS1_29]|uniref:Trp biosynthesis-associated membrane protein n=1 Tax=Lipingzhangella rawalii TaxID=2055835 RepID=A0ABU2H229_9ACTN|nr:Trp biosynthesis-associated membrane protein [Lipingzhangella rawalii]MDS1269351.1 Trp biosynthesis-associated membrane protein [Lipingzhangella rawalii]
MSRVSPGREYAVVLSVLAMAAGGLLLALSQSWAVPSGDAGPVPAGPELAGGEVSPLAAATAWAALASLAAVLATRGWARRTVGVVVAALAGAAAADIVRAVRVGPQQWSVGADTGAGGAAEAGSPTTANAETVGSLTLDWTWPVVGIVAAVVLLTVGVVVLTRGAAWPVMGARYDRGGGQGHAGDPQDPSTLWNALSEGLDPTTEGDAATREAPERSIHPEPRY